MSEDHQFNEDKPQINADKRRFAPDLLGSLGKGILAKEVMSNDQGLTPLSLSYDFLNRKSSDLTPLGERMLTTEGTKKQRRLSRISVPLSLCGENSIKGGN